nr:MAG: hypothetical protein [Bacteriophage sp.]
MASEKLVSVDAMRKWLKKIPLHDLSDGRGLCRIIFAEDFEKAMASFPGDAIQIVRCKDCEYGDYDSKPNGAMVCLRTNDGFWRKETDFCSYGERREE